MPITITIDGPAGSGKGTTAKKLAEKLGFKYFDSGALYRALGVYLDERGLNVENVEKELTGISMDFSPEDRVRVNGEDYEGKIRNVEASVFASKLSSQKYPRELVIHQGQEIIKKDNYVLEGRDTGTVWFPDAQVKIYLTADASVRAHRRWMELQAKGEAVSEEEVLKKICERDDRDMTRFDGPLQKPEGAHEIDTTHLTIAEQVERIYQIVQEVLQKEDNLS
ncbi:(d)CMP kinase [Candidatus Gracilibacteria bacterium]|nr:(d)CMP kinase [Candidatus Gracilibacteria bacterium]